MDGIQEAALAVLITVLVIWWILFLWLLIFGDES